MQHRSRSRSRSRVYRSRSPPRSPMRRRYSHDYERVPIIDQHTRTEQRVNYNARDPYYRPSNQQYQQRQPRTQRPQTISRLRFSSWEKRCCAALCSGLAFNSNTQVQQLVRRVLRRFEHHYDGRGLVLDFIELLEILPAIARSKMIYDNNTDAIVYNCFDFSRNYKSYFDKYSLARMIPMEYLSQNQRDSINDPIIINVDDDEQETHVL